jgi:hypothetical protein
MDLGDGDTIVITDIDVVAGMLTRAGQDLIIDVGEDNGEVVITVSDYFSSPLTSVNINGEVFDTTAF